MANKSFWDLDFFVEPWIHRFAHLFYNGDMKMSYKNEVGIIALGILKLNRSHHKPEQIERYEALDLQKLSIKLSHGYWKYTYIKSYDTSLSYSMAFNQALKNIFYREYIMYMNTCAEQLEELDMKVNYTELTRRFLLKYEVGDDDINVRSLQQVFNRHRAQEKMQVIS